MKLFLVVAFILICHSLGQQARYDAYQVLRVSINNDTDYERFYNIADRLELDVWATNRIEGWADVMVPPYQSNIFGNHFQAKIRIANVQTTLDEHEADMNSVVPNDVFDSFPTTGQVIQYLNEQIALHPGVATRVNLGQTYLGNDILGIRLGSTSRPMIFIHCTIHAREWITTTTCLWIIDQLLNVDPEGPALTQYFQWVIVPIFNVDGYDFTRSNRLWRKNRQPNTGTTCAGTDNNRNYGYAWGGAGSSNQPCQETYRGASAYSSPECARERDFLRTPLDSGTMAVYMDIHAYGGMFMSPWGYTYNYPPAQDYNVMNALMASAVSSMYAESGRTYAYGSSSNVIYMTSGGSNDWTYGDGGLIPSFVIETFGSSFTPPVSWIRPMGAEIYAGMKQLAIDIRDSKLHK